MAVIGDQFDVGSEICGIVLSIRGAEDILSIWNQSSQGGRTNLKIRYDWGLICRALIKSTITERFQLLTLCVFVNLVLCRDTMKRVLNLPADTIMEYKTHNDALKDNSSFRNTDVFR